MRDSTTKKKWVNQKLNERQLTDMKQLSQPSPQSDEIHDWEFREGTCELICVSCGCPKGDIRGTMACPNMKK